MNNPAVVGFTSEALYGRQKYDDADKLCGKNVLCKSINCNPVNQIYQADTPKAKYSRMPPHDLRKRTHLIYWT